jgi:tetratricopeptide (TPR) repeat protein
MGVTNTMAWLNTRAVLPFFGIAALLSCQTSERRQASVGAASTLCARGIAAANTRDARRFFEQAIASDPLFGPAYNNLGVLDFEANDYFNAAKNFDQAIKLMPYKASPRIHLGLIYEEAGQLNNALEQFDQALELAPDSLDALQANTRVRVKLGQSTPPVLSQLRIISVRGTDATWRSWAQQMLLRKGDTVSTTQP